MDFELNNEGLDDLFKHILHLMDESDRKYPDANKKVSKYMVSRMKCCRNSVRLLCSIDSSLKKTFDQDKLKQLNQTEGHIDKLLDVWNEKLKTSSVKNTETVISNFMLTPIYNGCPGRPKYHLDPSLVEELRGYHFNWTMISKILGIHRTTLWRHLKALGFNFDLKYSEISDNDLDAEIVKVKESHPLAGERMVIGILRSKGFRIQRNRVRASIHRVDPINTVKRWLLKNPRWVYSVPGPNSLWHNDGLHKLIGWGIVIHACIDGYSRLITSLLCATNNYASTALEGFQKGVSSFGLPARVRGDRGGENVGIMRYMREKQGYEGAYIQGPSVHNQRIERLHYDTTHCVLIHFIDLFHYLEEIGELQRENDVDLYTLHFVFVPKIQKGLDQFQEGWNHHQLSTEKNQTPYQLWLLGMMDCRKQCQRGVRRFYEDNTDDLFGVDISPGFECMPDDLSLVELHDVTFPNSNNIFEIIAQEFNPLDDDGEYGIKCFRHVKERVLQLLST